jgi:hypothetical protein
MRFKGGEIRSVGLIATRPMDYEVGDADLGVPPSGFPEGLDGRESGVEDRTR